MAGPFAYTFPEQDAVGSSDADGLTKTFPSVPYEFRVSGCGKNRGKAFQKNSEQSEDDWERGITQSCLLSQDHGNLGNRSENFF